MEDRAAAGEAASEDAGSAGLPVRQRRTVDLGERDRRIRVRAGWGPERVRRLRWWMRWRLLRL